MLRRNKKKRKKERKQSWRIDINNLALTLFMLVKMINSQHFYTDAKALKMSLLCYQLSKDLRMIDINNFALTLFMLINMINLRHFYTDVKALKKSLLRWQLQENNMMLWRLKDWVFKKKCSCENASHRLWMMHVCKTSLRD